MRTITGTLFNPNGTPSARSYITFAIVDLDGRETSSFNANTHEAVIGVSTVRTDNNGQFSIDLLENTNMTTETRYLVSVNNTEIFTAGLVPGTPIDWLEFMAGGEEITPAQMDFMQEQIDAAAAYAIQAQNAAATSTTKADEASSAATTAASASSVAVDSATTATIKADEATEKANEAKIAKSATDDNLIAVATLSEATTTKADEASAAAANANEDATVAVLAKDTSIQNASIAVTKADEAAQSAVQAKISELAIQVSDRVTVQDFEEYQLDLSTTNRFEIIVDQDSVILDPITLSEKQNGLIFITQDEIGNHSVDFEPAWSFMNENTANLDKGMTSIYSYEVYASGFVAITFVGSSYLSGDYLTTTDGDYIVTSDNDYIVIT